MEQIRVEARRKRADSNGKEGNLSRLDGRRSAKEQMGEERTRKSADWILAEWISADIREQKRISADMRE